MTCSPAVPEIATRGATAALAGITGIVLGFTMRDQDLVAAVFACIPFLFPALRLREDLAPALMNRPTINPTRVQRTTAIQVGMDVLPEGIVAVAFVGASFVIGPTWSPTEIGAACASWGLAKIIDAYHVRRVEARVGGRYFITRRRFSINRVLDSPLLMTDEYPH